MILSIGEILVDMIGFEKNGVVSYTAYAGGAPYNVACGISRLYGDIAFLGKVGDDLQGTFLYEHSLHQHFVANHIQKDHTHNTTLAFVKIDENGERDFSFHRIGTADYQFQDRDVDMSFLEPFHIIHVGSLMISEPKGMKFAKNVFRLSKKCHKIISFDVNFRSDIFKNQEEAIQKYQYFIHHADIVKYSKEELLMFAHVQDVKQALQMVSRKHQLICVTLGSEGSAYYLDGLFGVVPSISVHPKDTTGAGDAFFAGLLHRLDTLRWEELDAKKLNEIFYFANVCGALTTLNYGAIDAFPTLKKIHEVVHHGIQR